MAPTYPNHGRIDGPIVIIGFGSIGQGHAAADRAALHLRPARRARDRALGRAPDLPRAAGRALHPQGGDARRTTGRCSTQLFAGRPRVLREPVGRHQLARHHAALPRARACSTSTPWSSPGPGFYFDLHLTPRGALELRAARGGAGGEAGEPRRHHGGLLLRRQSRHGVLAAQGGAAAARRRHRPADRAAGGPRGWARLMQSLGVKGVHIAERDTQAGRDAKPIGTFVNTWSVEGFVSESFQPAELGWGTPRALVPAERPPARGGLQGGDLPRHAGAGHQGPHLDAGGGAAVRLPRHPQRGDLDRRLLHRRRGRRAGVPADLPLRLPPLRPGGAEPARDARLGRGAGDASKSSTRTRSSGARTSLGVLLYGHARNALWYGSRLSIEETPGAGAVPERDRAAGDERGDRRHGLGAGEPAGRHRRDRRDGPRPLPRGPAALPRAGRGALHRLDAARHPLAAVRRGDRRERPLAVPERAGDAERLCRCRWPACEHAMAAGAKGTHSCDRSLAAV